MNTRSVRAALAITVVGVFMLITGFMALYPLLGRASVDLDQYATFFAKTASVYTGIVGVIIGYYFGRSDQTDAERKKAREDANAATLETPGNQPQ